MTTHKYEVVKRKMLTAKKRTLGEYVGDVLLIAGTKQPGIASQFDTENPGFVIYIVEVVSQESVLCFHALCRNYDCNSWVRL